MRFDQSVESEELSQIELDWGQAPRQYHHLAVDHPFLTGNHQMLVSDGRRAEICYVMHRGSIADGLLLHIKTIYPGGAYRLPTGGIHVGESVIDTLAREIWEETGLSVGQRVGDVNVERYLGLLSYDFEHRSLQKTHTFATYCFLVQMPPRATLNPQDADEMIGGWRWQPANQMAAVADNLEGVGTDAPDWADWGCYRALVHRFVATILA